MQTQEKAEESRERLSRHYAAVGVQHLEKNDLPRSLVWFAEALKLDRKMKRMVRKHEVSAATQMDA